MTNSPTPQRGCHGHGIRGGFELGDFLLELLALGVGTGELRLEVVSLGLELGKAALELALGLGGLLGPELVVLLRLLGDAEGLGDLGVELGDGAVLLADQLLLGLDLGLEVFDLLLVVAELFAEVALELVLALLGVLRRLVGDGGCVGGVALGLLELPVGALDLGGHVLQALGALLDLARGEAQLHAQLLRLVAGLLGSLLRILEVRRSLLDDGLLAVAQLLRREDLLLEQPRLVLGLFVLGFGSVERLLRGLELLPQDLDLVLERRPLRGDLVHVGLQLLHLAQPLGAFLVVQHARVREHGLLGLERSDGAAVRGALRLELALEIVNLVGEAARLLAPGTHLAEHLGLLERLDLCILLELLVLVPRGLGLRGLGHHGVVVEPLHVLEAPHGLLLLLVGRAELAPQVLQMRRLALEVADALRLPLRVQREAVPLALHLPQPRRERAGSGPNLRRPPRLRLALRRSQHLQPLQLILQLDLPHLHLRELLGR
mmetsp:Transcript_44590/g.139840  ORF Transcript_44590/g.139840 Transcript_44590/m.139840 type:complete len:490 (-) Transcript_44590:991-2460(-)